MTLPMFGTTFHPGPTTAVLAAAEAAPVNGPRLVVTANIDHIVIRSENPAFSEAYDAAVVRTLDGMPLVWLARLFRNQNACRVTGHDLIAAVLAAPAAADTRVFLICASARVAERMRRHFLGAGLAEEAIQAEVPPLGFEEDVVYGHRLAGRVRRHGTSLLIMGVGAPKSEIWVTRQGPALGTPLVLAVGDALSVAAGLTPRAPMLMQRIGLEWFFRFLHAPRRLFRRYFVRSWRFLRIAAGAAMPVPPDVPGRARANPQIFKL